MSGGRLSILLSFVFGFALFQMGCEDASGGIRAMPVDEEGDDIDPWPEPDPEVVPYDQVEQLRLVNLAVLPGLLVIETSLAPDAGVDGGAAKEE